MTEFERRVLSAVRRISAGSCRDVWRHRGAGRKTAGITRGRQHHADGQEPGLPYHRVIGAGGAIGGYGGSVQVKRELLRAEGIEVGIGRIRGFERLRWRPTPKRVSGGRGSSRDRRPC